MCLTNGRSRPPTLWAARYGRASTNYGTAAMRSVGCRGLSAAAEHRSEHDVSVLQTRFEAYRTAESCLDAQQADSQFHHELARHHGEIDFELITTAMRRAGVLTD